MAMNIYAELKRLGTLTTPQLRAKYAEVFGEAVHENIRFKTFAQDLVEEVEDGGQVFDAEASAGVEDVGGCLEVRLGGVHRAPQMMAASVATAARRITLSGIMLRSRRRRTTGGRFRR